MSSLISKLGIILVSLLIIITFIPACGTTSTTATPTTQKPAAPAGPVYGGTLKIIEQMTAGSPIGYPPETLGGSSMFSRMALECLVGEDEQGKILPILAESWQLNSDKTAITFNLRKGVKFHDGTDFNADAVKWNFDLAKTAKKSGTNVWKSVDVVDANTIRIELTEYQNSLLSNIAGAGCLIISPMAFKTLGIDGVRWNPVGTGPFKFASFTRDVSVKFTRFDSYWDKGKPYLDGIEYWFIPDAMTAATQFQAGGYHIMRNNWDKIAADLNAAGFSSIGQSTGASALIPDSTNADSPISNSKVRQAIEYAIDKESIIKARGFGLWTAAYQMAPSYTMAYNAAINGRKYDPNKAKQLLTEAGYPNGFKTTITADPTSFDKDVVTAIQANLKAVGIDVQTDFPEFSKYSSMRGTGWKNGFLAQTLGVYANYTMGMQLYFTSASQFPSLAKTSAFLDQLKQALATSDYDTQKSMTQKASQLLYDDATIIPIYNVGMGYYLGKGVKLNDSGYFKRGTWPTWNPQNAWLGK
jgi:peptide/nickel transport system substrate-binding protein